MLPFSISHSSLTFQSFLNSLFYLVYSSFWSVTPFSRSVKLVSVLDGLDQILYLSLSILDGFNEPKPGSRTILTTFAFSGIFDSVWHLALFQKLISAGFPPCFARWIRSFFSDGRACVVFQNYKSRFFRVCQGVVQESVVVLYLSLFSSTIFLHRHLLPSAVHFMLAT